MERTINGFVEYLIAYSGIEEELANHLYMNLGNKTFYKGEFILKAGEKCQYTFFVESGLLRSYTISEQGKEHILQFAPENWFISDRGSVYFNHPADIYIDAIEDTQVVLIESHFMSEMAQEHQSFGIFNDRLLHNHIRHMQKRLNLLLAASAEERYLHFMKTYPDIMMRVPQWMVASYLGITPESLSRVRKELSKK